MVILLSTGAVENFGRDYKFNKIVKEIKDD
jgi:hypothetical protein